jgi:hypothetical protein
MGGLGMFREADNIQKALGTVVSAFSYCGGKANNED